MKNYFRSSFLIVVLILSVTFFFLGSGTGLSNDSHGNIADSVGVGPLNWEEAIDFCEGLRYAGKDDWRLPNVKELHSIVDYTKSPETHGTPAIDRLFYCTQIVNEADQVDYPCYWSSTTHAYYGGPDGEPRGGSANYIAFGRGMGDMDFPPRNPPGDGGDGWIDVHGAGCQRSEDKEFIATHWCPELPCARGPQGDAVRIYNYVRCVRDNGHLSHRPYAIVDTDCDSWTDTFGEDSDYTNNPPSYTDNGDGTVTDNVTGLMWQQRHVDTIGDGIITADDQVTFEDAVVNSLSFSLGGYDDWRLPTVKELYSLILFSGQDSRCDCMTECGAPKFIDEVFDQGSGCPVISSPSDRYIDGQTWTSTRYLSRTMLSESFNPKGDDADFGLNFLDGRIKGYPIVLHGTENTLYARYVRGNPYYGVNDFRDNRNGTITDRATGLTWTKFDSGVLDNSRMQGHRFPLKFGHHPDH